LKQEILRTNEEFGRDKTELLQAKNFLEDELCGAKELLDDAQESWKKKCDELEMSKRFLGDKLDIEIERYAKFEIIIKTLGIDKERLTKEKEILQRTALDFEKVIKSQRNDIDLWLELQQRKDEEDLAKAKALELSLV
jgi:hypothetical protein